MPRRTSTRSTVKLSKPMSQELSVYTLAASAAGVSVLALASPSSAEIIYTPAHQTIRTDQSYAIDLNHDGITDFTIENLVMPCSHSHTYCPILQVQAVPAAGAAIQTGYESFLAAALLPGAKIGISGRAKDRPEVLLDQFWEFDSYYHLGSWRTPAERYLGFHFKIDGEQHYGWARLRVESNFKTRLLAVLEGFAYETEAGKPILAGDVGSGKAQLESTPIDHFSFEAEGRPPAAIALGTFALGSSGIAMWRRGEAEAAPNNI